MSNQFLLFCPLKQEKQIRDPFVLHGQLYTELREVITQAAIGKHFEPLFEASEVIMTLLRIIPYLSHSILPDFSIAGSSRVIPTMGIIYLDSLCEAGT